VADPEGAAGSADSTRSAETRGSVPEGEGAGRLRSAALQHPARPPPPDRRGEEPPEAVEGAASSRDPPREVAELAVASEEGQRVRRALLRGSPRERAADMADVPLRAEQRPQARLVEEEGPARSVLVRSVVPAVAVPAHLPAASELTRDGAAEHRQLHPLDRDRRRPWSSMAGARARSSTRALLIAVIPERHPATGSAEELHGERASSGTPQLQVVPSDSRRSPGLRRAGRAGP